MELNSIQPPELSSAYSSSNPEQTQNKASNSSPSANLLEKKDLEKKDLDKEKLEDTVGKMNEAMAALNTTIRFSLHEKTSRLIVQVVDIAKDEVIKEFPPHEFLDTQAKIRDYIGVLLDIKG